VESEAILLRLNEHGICCPMNFVRTKLAIDEIKPVGRIEILLDDSEPIINVSRSVKDE
jgi:TusA-related sulfurtransferase